MTIEEMEELKGLAASMGLYDDKNPCKRAVILGKAIKELEQEPKPMVEIDLYSVIKQKYIEREVLDKIRNIVDEWRLDTWTDNISYECMVKIAELLATEK